MQLVLEVLPSHEIGHVKEEVQQLPGQQHGQRYAEYNGQKPQDVPKHSTPHLLQLSQSLMHWKPIVHKQLPRVCS